MAQKPEQEVDSATRKKHVVDWPKSGLSKSAYCAQHGILLNQLLYWQQLDRGRRPRKMEAAFVKATVVRAPASVSPDLTECVRLLVGGGAVLEIKTGVDPIWAARLIGAIGGRP